MKNLISLSLHVAYVLLVLQCLGCSDKLPSTIAQSPAPNYGTKTLTTQGEVVGFYMPNGTAAWRGIRYAQPPLNDRRWRSPIPPTAWPEPVMALNHAPRCPQLATRLDHGVEVGMPIGQEDCLFLDVYAPSDISNGDKVPVMIWIHGGSNVWGGADQYDGSKLAANQKVIVVVPQYRLGPLGWFAHPTIQGKTTGAIAANFALLDQQLALKWVVDNISAFGGDPDNITLFGESAGAFNVFSLLSMPGSEKYVRKAILQSGAPSTHSLDEAIHGEHGSVAALAKLGSNHELSANNLRELPVQALLNVFSNNDKINVVSQIADGVTLSSDGVIGNIAQNYGTVPLSLIIGANRDETKFYTAFNDKFVWRLLGKLPIIRDSDFYEALSEYTNNYWYQAAVLQTAQQLNDADIKTYLYRFDWDNQPDFLGIEISKLIGAAHTLEVPFIFDSFDNFLEPMGSMFFSEENEQSRNLLKSEMQSLWGSFAYSTSGSPEGSQWQPHSTKEPFILQLDADQKLQVGRLNYKYPSFTEQIHELRTDHRVPSEEKKCIIYEEMRTLHSMIQQNKQFSSKCPFISED
ncbi:carboxylesterase/lipase family protein [Pseudoalteromonas lipolytica]|uniref:Carboxylic ester hydrolase n=1 Tax=Pseudoalteromonas lipolytica TaxID=570156 RepID=A0ABU8SZ24_9GAMM